ncbi:hypothetical protein RDI58_014526 [Solanum bulbocastanum]|uniref:RNase H type-1 domain-containing protein n=1 Tax=Solanum bulbocastanum TaxID=147425 RepID=A0AAN8TID1_SOLBU
MHTLIQFMKARKKILKYAPYKWSTMVEAIYRYSHTVKIIKVIWKPPDTGCVKVKTHGALSKSWEDLLGILQEIWGLIKGRTVVITQILREGNKLYDHLANMALDEGPLAPNTFQELDTQSRRIINSDKLNEPYLRVGPCRK